MAEQIVSLDQLDNFAKNLLRDWAELVNIYHQATVVGIEGELGAGKTTLVQALGRALGVKEPITSPTFVFWKRYPVQDSGRRVLPVPWRQLYHFDLYRLDKMKELESLNWQTVINEPGALVLVEWPERAGAALPVNSIIVTLKRVSANENQRQIQTSLYSA